MLRPHIPLAALCLAAACATQQAPHEVPIACDLSVFTPAERRAHSALFEEVVLGQARSIEELEDGYVYHYTYPADSELLLVLSRWVANERRCCPFLWFGLEVEPEGGELLLRLRGREGVKALLAAELDARGALSRVH